MHSLAGGFKGAWSPAIGHPDSRRMNALRDRGDGGDGGEIALETGPWRRAVLLVATRWQHFIIYGLDSFRCSRWEHISPSPGVLEDPRTSSRSLRFKGTWLELGPRSSV